jgi:sRNA-binding carbon storage regulator CsrA
MLVLTRKKLQTLVVEGLGGEPSLLLITVLGIVAGRVRIGFTTNSRIPIHRGETWCGVAPGQGCGGVVQLRTRHHDEATDLPPLNIAATRERVSGGATQGRARDATTEKVRGGADHREAPRG